MIAMRMTAGVVLLSYSAMRSLSNDGPETAAGAILAAFGCF
jgi:hypothetical protein